MISTTDSRHMVAHAKLLFHGDLPLLSFLIKKDEDLEDVKKSMGGLR